MDFIKIALLLLQLLKWLVEKGKEKRIIAETEQRILTEGLIETAKAAGIAKDVRDKFANMSDSDLLATGAEDFRD